LFVTFKNELDKLLPVDVPSERKLAKSWITFAIIFFLKQTRPESNNETISQTIED
jgi:hypothetical protein